VQAEKGLNFLDEYNRILSLRGAGKPSVQESLASSAVKTAQERELMICRWHNLIIMTL
jgi:hypothetical protein